MKFAAVDIGSNAIRMQVSQVIEYRGVTTFKKVEFIRFPLRLGHDVFNLGKISDENEEKFVRLMKAFKMLIDLYEVDDLFACATSAMRESQNGKEIVQKVKDETGLDIHIIDGQLEAELINQSLESIIDANTYLLIDVGGGSTELSLFVNRQKLLSKSFKLGSVRNMEKKDQPGSWREMEKWIHENIKDEFSPVTAIGTGGNIFKTFELTHAKSSDKITLAELQNIQQFVAGHTMEERLNILLLNPDRADVIVPALDIYISAMKWAKAVSMIVPDVGLKDGLIYHLYEKAKQKSQ